MGCNCGTGHSRQSSNFRSSNSNFNVPHAPDRVNLISKDRFEKRAYPTNQLIRVTTATVIEVVDCNGDMCTLKIRDENKAEYITRPIRRSLIPTVSSGHTVQVHTGISGDFGGDDGYVLICALGGPVAFGACVFIALLLLSGPVY